MYQLTTELAELLGIIAGDGSISRYISKKRSNYLIEISGNNEEVDYFEYVSVLIIKSFGLKPKLKQRKDGIRLILRSKKTLEFLESLGMPLGKKARIIRIPKKIRENKELSCAFLRGLADTDFCIEFKKGDRKKHSYPSIRAEFASKKLVEDISEVLNQLKIKHNIYIRNRITNFGKAIHFEININGRKNLKVWMEFIGFNNSKHLTKIDLWNKWGYCPPKTTLSERLNILKNN